MARGWGQADSAQRGLILVISTLEVKMSGTRESPPIQSFFLFMGAKGLWWSVGSPLFLNPPALSVTGVSPIISFSSNSVLTLAFHRV